MVQLVKELPVSFGEACLDVEACLGAGLNEDDAQIPRLGIALLN